MPVCPAPTSTSVLAQPTVADLRAAEPLDTALLRRAPDEGAARAARHAGRRSAGVGGGRRLLRLTEPDGNRVVVLGA